MSLGATVLPVGGSGHLEQVVDEVERSAAQLRSVLATATSDRLAALTAEGRRSIVAATLHLDGAPPGGPTDRMPMGGGPRSDGSDPDAQVTGERPGTWLDALQTSPGIDGAAAAELPADEEVARLIARERDGVHAGLDAEDLLEAFSRATADPAGLGAALCVLHGRLTSGLVDASRAGRLRRGARVVHDASVGRIIFFPTDPVLLSDAWDALLRGLTLPTATGSPPIVRAGLLHLELLRHHPFDAANGRLARAAARLVLRSDGVLPPGVAHELVTIEAVLDADALGYLDGVAASARRRDATGWIERWGESVTLALVRAARRVGQTDAQASSDGIPLPTTAGFTLADAMEVSGQDLETTRRGLSDAVLRGRIERSLGSAGLRYVQPGQGMPTDVSACDRSRRVL